MARVVLLDYKGFQSSNLVKALNGDGIDAKSVNDFARLLLEMFSGQVALVVIDLEFSGLNDIEILKKIRSSKNMQSLGIIFVVNDHDLDHRLALIANGADACLHKPLDKNELRIYINNICQRIQTSALPVIQSEWHFHASEWRLEAPSGQSLDLSHLETKLVAMLVKVPGKPVKRREIIAVGFGLDPLLYDGRRLDAIISRLRRKMRDIYPLSQPIKVVHSVGYIFMEPVRCSS